jgi:hypothetical protein
MTTLPLAPVVTCTLPELTLVLRFTGDARRPVADALRTDDDVDVFVAVRPFVVVTVAPLMVRTPRLAAAVGVGVAPEESVGVNVPLLLLLMIAPGVTSVVPVAVAAPVVAPGPAANWPAVSALAAAVGVTIAVLELNTGAATDVPLVIALLAIELLVPTFGVTLAALVTVGVPLVANVPPLMTMLPLPSPPPLVTTSVGPELIDEFTVICGLTIAGTTCPVTCCAESSGPVAAGNAGPR